ncbi:MAG: diguanylate cyclase [Alteromonadaceae bacterium]|nr:diguanylate cyclase [Alteromonadaceae bacterium]
MLQTSYGTNFKIRLIIVFTTTTLFYAAYEYIRGKNMETINCLKERIEHLALHDALTGIPNRRAMNLYLQREVIRAKRTNSPLSFILCDIDKFKLINDKLGHDVGDEVLIFVSKLLRENIRKQDLVARWGGEEFCLHCQKRILTAR